MGEFTPEQEAAIQEKMQLYSILKGTEGLEFLRLCREIEQHITEKRLRWYEAHRDELEFTPLQELIHTDRALAVLFDFYMQVDYDDLELFQMVDQDHGMVWMHIHAYNFCPYLEAFKRLGFPPEVSVKLCELTLEEPCQKLMKQIHPNLVYNRFYDKIRPLTDHCLEMILVRDGKLCYDLMMAGAELFYKPTKCKAF